MKTKLACNRFNKTIDDKKNTIIENEILIRSLVDVFLACNLSKEEISFLYDNLQRFHPRNHHHQITCTTQKEKLIN